MYLPLVLASLALNAPSVDRGLTLMAQADDAVGPAWPAFDPVRAYSEPPPTPAKYRKPGRTRAQNLRIAGLLSGRTLLSDPDPTAPDPFRRMDNRRRPLKHTAVQRLVWELLHTRVPL